MSSATGDRLHPSAIRTSLPALKQVARRLTETMQTKGSLAHMEEMREIVSKLDGRYRKKGKFEELLNYHLRTGSILVDPGKNGRLYFDDERAAVIDEARSRNNGYAPAAEAAATRIAALKRRHEEHQRRLEEALTPIPPPPPPADQPVVQPVVAAAAPPPSPAVTPAPSRKHRKREKIEPSPGADKVLYLTPDEEEKWTRAPWFANPERYFIIPIEKREECPVPTRLAEIISHIEEHGFEVKAKELVREAFDRLSKRVDPDAKLNQATTYLKIAGYRPDYATNGWGVIFLWKKGERILTGVKGYGRFTYVPMDGPIKRQQRAKATPVSERAVPLAAKAPTPPPPPPPPADPYTEEAIVALGETELLALRARVLGVVRMRLDAKQADLNKTAKRIAGELAGHTLEQERLNKLRQELLGETDSKTLSN